MDFYSIALPIGNADDLGFRAKQILESADFIFCEDTRKFNEFCKRANIKKKSNLELHSLPGDQEFSLGKSDLEKIQKKSGMNICVQVSDAGTPVVNDPGKNILELARQCGWSVRAIPGPSAPILAWQWSGGFGLPFYFAGFVPKARAKSKLMKDFFTCLSYAKTFVCFDTKHQVLETMAYLEENLGQNKVWLVREMTKPHEEIIGTTLQQIKQTVEKRFKEFEGAFGELTWVIEGEPTGMTDEDSQLMSIDDVMTLRFGKPKDAAKLAQKLLKGKIKSQEVYEMFFTKENEE